jgi:hypothetical protein
MSEKLYDYDFDSSAQRKADQFVARLNGSYPSPQVQAENLVERLVHARPETLAIERELLRPAHQRDDEKFREDDARRDAKLKSPLNPSETPVKQRRLAEEQHRKC